MNKVNPIRKLATHGFTDPYCGAVGAVAYTGEGKAFSVNTYPAIQGESRLDRFEGRDVEFRFELATVHTHCAECMKHVNAARHHI